MSINPIINQNSIRRSAANGNTRATLQLTDCSVNLLPRKMKVSDFSRVALGDIQNTVVVPRERVKSSGDLDAHYYYSCQTAQISSKAGIVYEKTTKVVRASSGGVQYDASNEVVRTSGCGCLGTKKIARPSASTNLSSVSHRNANSTAGSTVCYASMKNSTGSSYYSENTLQVPKTNRSRSTSEISNSTTQSSPMLFKSAVGSTPFNGSRSSVRSQNLQTSKSAFGSFKSLLGDTSIISRNTSNSSTYSNLTQGSKYEQSLKLGFTTIKSNNNDVLLRENTILRKEPKLKTKLEKKQLINKELEFSYEYLEDMYHVMLKEELNILIPYSHVNCLKRNYSARAGVINWLLKLQRFVNFQENEFYITVRLFDMTLIKAEIPHNLFQLLALTILWISIKINSVKPLIKLSTLLSMCNNSFTKEQLIKMEQKVLSLNKFKITSMEPTLFVHYYLAKLKISHEKMVLYASLYILDSMSIKWDFSCVKMSTLSMAAVNYALCRLNDKTANYFEGIVHSDVEEMLETMEDIYETLGKICDTNYVFREPYFKYCDIKMCQVSKLII